MKRINILDEHTSNKIAAGEVVERPSSVVKELVENSIDAEAKNITVEIEEGGISLIRIIDDGVGIVSEDIEKAFLPHATSKISSVEDIYSISTLGFRGEALPSIASVSKLSFRSRTKYDDFGKEIILEAGTKVELNDIGMNAGTVIEVKDLFFNVPARKKFLKSVSREGSLINDILTRIALSNPSVSIKFYNNGKKAIHTYGDGNLSNVIRTIYGKNISDHILKFENISEGISINGYVGKEIIARGSRNNQSIYVNNRYIKNKTIVAAIENAFKSFSTVNKFPFFILFIDIDPNTIDVNIHPTKAEIKFDDERMIFKKVFDTVHSVLKEDIFNSFIVEKENEVEHERIEEIKLNIQETSSLPNRSNETYRTTEPTIESVYNRVNINDVEKEESLYQKLKGLNIGVTEDAPSNIAYNNSDVTYNNPFENNTKVSAVNDVSNNNYISAAKIQEANCVNQHEEVVEKVNIAINNSLEAKFPQLRVIGQFSKTYILAEYLDVLYIIDQHAAHEKILYEKYLKSIKESDLVVQPLLIPTIIDLSIDDYECYKENLSVITDAGFVVDEFGGNTIAIKDVPYFLGTLDAKNLLLDILDNLKQLGSGKTEEVKLNKIASMSCRRAVKANDFLTQIEMEKLIDDLRFIDNPFHCPHGRPIIIKFTEYELDKKFKRIV